MLKAISDYNTSAFPPKKEFVYLVYVLVAVCYTITILTCVERLLSAPIGYVLYP